MYRWLYCYASGQNKKLHHQQVENIPVNGSARKGGSRVSQAQADPAGFIQWPQNLPSWHTAIALLP